MFKKIKRKNVRQKIENDDSDDDKTGVFIDDLKEVQKLRRRQHGISLEDLGAVQSIEKPIDAKKDPFKMETGGYIDMKKMKEIPDDVQEQIGTEFASETNRRDEDTEMLKYVEVEMKKRKGLLKEEEQKHDKTAEDKLYELPENLKGIKGRKKTKEDMISFQMLSGIPEVDLGIEAKIKNIEQTEEAKQRLIREKNNKNNTVSDFVPTNYAVNFVQHNRFNIEDHSAALKRKMAREREEVPTPAPLRVGDVERLQTGQEQAKVKRIATEKATDDFHFEKFKKQMRKY